MIDDLDVVGCRRRDHIRLGLDGDRPCVHELVPRPGRIVVGQGLDAELVERHRFVALKAERPGGTESIAGDARPRPPAPGEREGALGGDGERVGFVRTINALGPRKQREDRP